MSSALSLSIIAVILSLFMLVALGAAFFIWIGLEKVNKFLRIGLVGIGPKANELHILLNKTQKITNNTYFQLRRVSNMADTVGNTASKTSKAIRKPLQRLTGPDSVATLFGFLASKRRKTPANKPPHSRGRLRSVIQRIPTPRLH